MGILGILLLVIFVIASLLLIFLVIIQDEDSDSLGGIFAGGSGSAFGSRSSNVVIKITYVLGALFFVTAFTLAILNKSSIGNVEAAVKPEQAQSSSEWWKGPTAAPATPAPASPATEGTSTTIQPASSATTTTVAPAKK
jgi:preprotein translocase subunit SecG